MKYSVPVTALFVGTLVSCGTSVPQSGSSQNISPQLQASSTYGGRTYTVYIENTASVAIKDAIRRQGGTQLQLVIAMAEEKTLDTRNWPAGFGDGKSGDAANFGAYKMNWYMIRLAMKDIWPTDPVMANLGPNDYNKLWPGSSLTIANRINSDYAMATRILQKAMTKWSTGVPTAGAPNNFWAGHRCGQTGLEGRSCTWRTFDNEIGFYYNGVMAVNQFINQNGSKYGDLWTSSVRYGANLFPI